MRQACGRGDLAHIYDLGQGTDGVGSKQVGGAGDILRANAHLWLRLQMDATDLHQATDDDERRVGADLGAELFDHQINKTTQIWLQDICENLEIELTSVD